MATASSSMQADCVAGNYALNQRAFLDTCGYSYFVPLSPGVGFTGTKFEDTTQWVKRYQDQVRAAVQLEVLSGYPRTSYVPLMDRVSPPSNFHMCVE